MNSTGPWARRLGYLRNIARVPVRLPASFSYLVTKHLQLNTTCNNYFPSYYFATFYSAKFMRALINMAPVLVSSFDCVRGSLKF